MREYKLVTLNDKLHLTRAKDVQQAQDALNKYAAEGWILQQIVAPSDLSGAMVAILYKEK